MSLPKGDGEESEGDRELVEEEEQEEEEEDGGPVGQQGRHAAKRQQRTSSSSSSITYDTSLPGSHSYLGADLEEVRGRTILEDDSVVDLPLITLPGMILVPGQIIPLHLFHQHTVAMIKNVVDNDKTFGIVASRTSMEDYSTTLAGIGTTAEIYSVKNEMDEGSGIATVRVKARGRQRFELVEYRRTVTGTIMGKVKILTDIILPGILDGARPPSHCKFCANDDTAGDENLKMALDRQGNVFACVSMRKPLQKILIQRVKTELHKWNDTLSPDKMPSDATELSYWVTQNLPLDDSLRLHLLSINNAVQRLRCALSMIVKYSVLCCKDCFQQLADKKDVFSLALEGPLAAYVNPGGHVHEMLTMHKVLHLVLIGRPSTEHSWFPGYAWTIAQCSNCNSHMGWKFTARRKDLSPQKFWGLCRNSLVPGISNPGNATDADWMPVM